MAIVKDAGNIGCTGRSWATLKRPGHVAAPDDRHAHRARGREARRAVLDQTARERGERRRGARVRVERAGIAGRATASPAAQEDSDAFHMGEDLAWKECSRRVRQLLPPMTREEAKL